MAEQFIIGCFVAIVVGVALLVLGLRGRRLDRNPTCRLCGFDLSGVFPDGPTCPECGAGLKRDRAIRVGQRRRMWAIAVLGALLVVLPAGGLATGVFVMLSGADTHRYKPLGILLWEIGRPGNADYAEALAREFCRRRGAGVLDEAQELRVAEAILGLQADIERPWCEEFGDFLELARVDGVLDDEHYDRFLRQALRFEVQTRPSMRPGDPLPVVAKFVEARTGSASEINAIVWLTGITFDGEPPPRPGRPEGDSSDPGPFPPGAGMFMAVGSATKWTPSTTAIGNTVGLLATVPESAALGPAKIGATLTCRVESISAKSGYATSPILGPPGEGKGVAVRHTTTEVRVTSSAANDVALIEPTEELSVRLARALVPLWARIESGEQGLDVQLGFQLGMLPVPVACDVFWRVGEDEWKVGSFTSGSGVAIDASMGACGEASDRHTSGFVGLSTPDNVELVLRPNPDLALSTTDLTSIYGGEIVITNSQIKNMGPSFQVDGEFVGVRWVVPSGG